MKAKIARMAERGVLFLLGSLFLFALGRHVLARAPENAETYILSMVCIAVFTAILEIWMTVGGRTFYALAAASCVLLGIGTSYQRLFQNDDEKYLLHLALFYILAIVVFLLMRGHLTLSNRQFYALSLLIVFLLALNLIFGQSRRGAALWIRIPLIGSLQLGELAKPLLLFLGASCCRDVRRCAIYSAVTLCWCGALTLIFHDLGNAFVIFMMFALAVYLLLDSRVISISIISGAAVAFLTAVHASAYAQSRMDRWLRAMEDADQYGNVGQQGQMIKAILLGGFNGLGIRGSGVVTRIIDAQNDLALAGVWAAYGLCFLALAFLCYALIVRQALCDHSVTPASHLILWQFSALIYCPVLLNFLGSVDALPFTGIVAPFISLGGSSLASLGIAFGLAAAALCPSLVPSRASGAAEIREGGEIL